MRRSNAIDAKISNLPHFLVSSSSQGAGVACRLVALCFQQADASGSRPDARGLRTHFCCTRFREEAAQTTFLGR
jgi:hypothetical protein